MKYVAKVGGFTLRRPPSGIGFGAKFEFFQKRALSTFNRFIETISRGVGPDDHLHIDENQWEIRPKFQ
jgi:hypothetical protein